MPRFAHQEAALPADAELDVLSAVSLLTQQLPKQARSITDDEALITGVELHSDFLPPQLQSDLAGLDFGQLDIRFQGRSPYQAVNLELSPRRTGEPERLIRLLDYDETTMEVEDSAGPGAQLRDEVLAPYVGRHEVALYLAYQALRNADEASVFVLENGGPGALAAAANLLTLRGETKVISSHAAQEVALTPRRKAMLHVQTITGYMLNDPFGQPSHVMHSAWLVQNHNPRTPELSRLPLIRRLFVEYSPTYNMTPPQTHRDTQSIRVELETPSSVDQDLLDEEVRQLAAEGSQQLFSQFTKIAAELDPRRRR